MDGDEGFVSHCPNCGWRSDEVKRFDCPECGGPAKVIRDDQPGRGVRPIANGSFPDCGTTTPPPVPDPRIIDPRRRPRPSDQRPI
jgi:predicted RNA-binding Zn-ribbon protein involved in translation (DUF1610 family)